MSAEAERVFSGARRQVDWPRCRLKASTIETLECLEHWLITGITKGAYHNEIERIEGEAAVATAIQQAEEQAREAQQRADEQDDEQAEEEEAATAVIIDLELQRSIDDAQAVTGGGEEVN
ncbi:HAT domain-containing protein [Macrophomina phaseolina MS6]|uniref:HAT domain-containing protein n=1 Tax=Macrophomina phaseolina (strain MS6) TaxID=1126212 RepID=K2R5H8_MACPH|nr:HAT domain-containing protein [Macrophomina phaseolina MS6]